MSIDRARRGLVAALALLMAVPALAGTWRHELGTLTLDGTPRRIVTLNWAATEAVLLLGVTPVGVANMDGYGYWVKEPPLPESGVFNVGLRMAPSLEAIAELKPDLIVTSTELAPAAELLERIAPTYVISVYRDGSQPYETARTQLLTLDREDRAQAVLDDIEQTLASQRARLERAGLTDRPVLLVSFMDDRHVRLYTPNGLFQKALDGLGLSNAWPTPGSFWGFSLVGLEAIAEYPDARLIVLSPTPPGLAERQQVYQIDTVWPFGGVYPIKRLATLITDSLLAGGADRVR
jgi:iron complex transport system substrate-binding protein